jgi:hypothetical protein
MKTTVLFLFLLFGVMGHGQEKPKVQGGKADCDPEELPTREFTMDLSKPSLKTKGSKPHWLSMRARELLIIKIENGNPLKYSYKIDTKELAFFSQGAPAEPKATVENPPKENVWGANGIAPGKIEDFNKINEKLKKDVESLTEEFEAFYADMKERSFLDTKEFDSRRNDFWVKATNYNDQSDELLKELEKLKDSAGYKETKEKVEATKGKAKKLKEEIKKKLYGFDFATFTMPIDVQGRNIDAIEFRLRRFNKETKEEDTGFAPHPYNVWIKGGLKIDISAGLFFTSLFDEAFEKKDDPDTEGNKIIIKKNQGDYDFAFGSSINVHSRWNSWLNMGGNLGVAFTTNQKFQILTGVNFIFGKQERIILSAGLAMGKVDRLANSYKEGGSYNLGAEGTIPMESQFKFGHFFGVTYNLSKVKKISLEKGIEQ